MHDFEAFRRAAIRYWERRRIVYNFALVLPSLFGYLVGAGAAAAGDPSHTLYGVLAFWFSASAVGANVCYSFAYVLEFFFGSDDPDSGWLKSGRSAAFVAGILFAMVLAPIGGFNIASIEYYERARLR